MGKSLWTSVGVPEGDGDGWLVDGEELGTSECICVGFGVGDEVVGLVLGALECVSVGLVDGMVLGESDGRIDGPLLGDAEGNWVGRVLTDGLVLGVAVGLSVLSELMLSSYSTPIAVPLASTSSFFSASSPPDRPLTPLPAWQLSSKTLQTPPFASKIPSQGKLVVQSTLLHA